MKLEPEMSPLRKDTAFRLHWAAKAPRGRGSGPTQLRFGVFVVDLAARSLWRDGLPVRIQEKPFRLLEALLERPGKVVSRARLQERLWPKAEYGAFDLGLNTAARKLRRALGDSAARPRYIETVPRMGYRFVARVEANPAAEPSDHRPPEPSVAATGRQRFGSALLAIALLLIGVGYLLAAEWMAWRGF